MGFWPRPESRIDPGGAGGMNILFIHQNMPGQFKALAPFLAAHDANRVVFLTQHASAVLPRVRRVTYAAPPPPVQAPHPYLVMTDRAVRTGQQVIRACDALRGEGFRPDLIIGHPGWGEALFLKDFYPNVPLLSYCEFYYRGRGLDVGFDPNDQPGIDVRSRTRMRASHLLLALEAADRGVSPTYWQRDAHPSQFRSKIDVIFDGIDTTAIAPAADASFDLPDGRRLTRGDRIVTYAARDLEPYRGFPSFMRSVPRILAGDPEARIVIVGRDGVSYGNPPAGAGTWREAMLKELGPLDPERVYFLPRQPHAQLLSLMRVSSAHVYLTYPFVLSWSFLEALACGCAVVASRTAPVEEVARDGDDAILVDFFDSAAIADGVLRALRGGAEVERLRRNARRTVVQKYDVRESLNRYLQLLNAMV